MLAVRAALAAALLMQFLPAEEHVSFRTRDGGVIYADVYGQGERGVVLAHGARFNKESWAHQAQALADAGFRAVAIDFRGYGQSQGPGQSDPFTAPLHLDILAAVQYLRSSTSKSVALVGASLGGAVAAQAVLAAQPGEIDRLVLLAATPVAPPEKLTGRKLYIVARDDAGGAGPLLPKIRAHFEKAPEPKQLIIVDGSAHAQFLFQTSQADRVLHDILSFLAEP